MKPSANASSNSRVNRDNQPQDPNILQVNNNQVQQHAPAPNPQQPVGWNFVVQHALANGADPNDYYF